VIEAEEDPRADPALVFRYYIARKEPVAFADGSEEKVRLMESESQGIYVTPRIVTDISQCYFYHTIDLPEIGTIEGNWDLRDRMSEYFGDFDFRGKRVLDVGTANGILSFSMEKAGAEVISFDLDKQGSWDFVPFANWTERDHIARHNETMIDQLNNAYWFCHRLNKSKAKVVYGNVYNIPEEIGLVDVAMYGCILLHLRDPFLALQSGLKITRESVIVTECLRRQIEPNFEPYMKFLPDAKTQEPKGTWWDLRPELIVRMIGVLGFEETTITYHIQKYEGREMPMYTVVGRRTHGSQLA
jgi:hypothetical protein